MTGLPRVCVRVWPGNEALLGQRTEQTLGCSGGRSPGRGEGRGPSKCVHAAFGGPGARSPWAPSPGGLLQSLGGAAQAGVRGSLRPGAPAIHPSCGPPPAGGSLQGWAHPWVRVAWSFPFGDGKGGAGPPPPQESPLLPEAQQMGNRGEVGAPPGGPILFGKGRGSQFPAYKNNESLKS